MQKTTLIVCLFNAEQWEYLQTSYALDVAIVVPTR